MTAQVVFGWISPFTPLLTGFMAGMVVHDENEGSKVGFLVGLITAAGFYLREYLGFGLPYVYPTQSFMAYAGMNGQIVIGVIMLLLGFIGGRVGGSVMQRALQASYDRGLMFGEAKRTINDLDEQLAKNLETQRKHRKPPSGRSR